MTEIEKFIPGKAVARDTRTRSLPLYGREVTMPVHGPKLSSLVTGVELWSDARDDHLRRRLKRALDRGQVAGAYYLPDRGDGRVWAEVQLLPGRRRNWLRIGVLSTIALGGIGVAAGLTIWMAKLMAAVASGAAQVGGAGVLLLIGVLLLAAGGGTVTVTTVTTIRRSWF